MTLISKSVKKLKNKYEIQTMKKLTPLIAALLSTSSFAAPPPPRKYSGIPVQTIQAYQSDFSLLKTVEKERTAFRNAINNLEAMINKEISQETKNRLSAHINELQTMREKLKRLSPDYHRKEIFGYMFRTPKETLQALFCYLNSDKVKGTINTLGDRYREILQEDLERHSQGFTNLRRSEIEKREREIGALYTRSLEPDPKTDIEMNSIDNPNALHDFTIEPVLRNIPKFLERYTEPTKSYETILELVKPTKPADSDAPMGRTQVTEDPTNPTPTAEEKEQLLKTYRKDFFQETLLNYFIEKLMFHPFTHLETQISHLGRKIDNKLNAKSLENTMNPKLKLFEDELTFLKPEYQRLDAQYNALKVSTDELRAYMKIQQANNDQNDALGNRDN